MPLATRPCTHVSALDLKANATGSRGSAQLLQSPRVTAICRWGRGSPPTGEFGSRRSAQSGSRGPGGTGACGAAASPPRRALGPRCRAEGRGSRATATRGPRPRRKRALPAGRASGPLTSVGSEPPATRQLEGGARWRMRVWKPPGHRENVGERRSSGAQRVGSLPCVAPCQGDDQSPRLHVVWQLLRNLRRARPGQEKLNGGIRDQM